LPAYPTGVFTSRRRNRPKLFPYRYIRTFRQIWFDITSSK
jgi:hypothetical protein